MSTVGKVFKDPLILEILEKYRTIWSIGHAQSLLGWDMETYMPPEGVAERAIASQHLSMLNQRLLLEPRFVELVEKAKQRDGLTDPERGVVRVLDREITRLKKLPPELVGEIAKTRVEAQDAWKRAREKDDYQSFKPYLDKVFALAREVAERLGYEDEPYDALLDYYEEGLRTRDAQAMFDGIIPTLKKTLDKLMSEENSLYPKTHPLESKEYAVGEAEEANKAVLDLLVFPWQRGRLDVSAHPFTTSMGIRDVRITTRYEGFDIKRTLYATIHEYGHALYELQVDESLMATPIDGGVSLGIHESQSRFWENIVGRSRPMAGALAEIVNRKVPSLGRVDSEEFYRYANTVKPSLIRVEADEVTYNFHILIRFRLERMLLNREINVDDLPELWNDMMEEYLGIRPKTYREGVLQDIHWSGGLIGYFPTYTIGNVVSAQILEAMQQTLGDPGTLVAQGEARQVAAWLREKIHRYGSTYSPQELLERSLGKGMDTEPYKRYITRKYLMQ